MTAWSLCRRETRACVVPSQQQELWWAACGTGSGIYFRNCALCQAWKKPANLNKMFVFAEKHPASATLTNAVFGQDTLSETSLQSHCSSTYNSHKLTEKMKTLLEGVCVGECLWVAWNFWIFGGGFGFLVVVRCFVFFFFFCKISDNVMSNIPWPSWVGRFYPDRPLRYNNNYPTVADT